MVCWKTTSLLKQGAPFTSIPLQALCSLTCPDVVEGPSAWVSLGSSGSVRSTCFQAEPTKDHLDGFSVVTAFIVRHTKDKVLVLV